MIENQKRSQNYSVNPYIQKIYFWFPQIPDTPFYFYFEKSDDKNAPAKRQNDDEREIFIDTIIFYDFLGRKKFITKYYLFRRKDRLLVEFTPSDKSIYYKDDESTRLQNKSYIPEDIQNILNEYQISDTSPVENINCSQIYETLDDKTRCKARCFKVFFEAMSDFWFRPLSFLPFVFTASGFVNHDAQNYLEIGSVSLIDGLFLFVTIAFIAGSFWEYCSLNALQKKLKNEFEQGKDNERQVSPIVADQIQAIKNCGEFFSPGFIFTRHGLQIFFLTLTALFIALSIIATCLAGVGGVWATVGSVILVISQCINVSSNLFGFIRQFFLFCRVLYETWNQAWQHWRKSSWGLFLTSKFFCIFHKYYIKKYLLTADEKKTWKNYKEFWHGTLIFVIGAIWNQRIWKMSITIFLLYWSIDCRLLWILSSQLHLFNHHFFRYKQIDPLDSSAVIAYGFRGCYNFLKCFIWDRYKCQEWFGWLINLSNHKSNLIDDIIGTKAQIKKLQKPQTNVRDTKNQKVQLENLKNKLKSLKEKLTKKQEQLKKRIFGDKAACAKKDQNSPEQSKKINSTNITILTKIDQHIKNQTVNKNSKAKRDDAKPENNSLYNRKWWHIYEHLKHLSDEQNTLNTNDNKWNLTFWQRKFTKLEKRAAALNISLPRDLERLKQFVENDGTLKELS